MDVREKLVELIANYFDIGDSYAYNLTRVKSAFDCGTMGLDDFEEFNDETVSDIAEHLIAHGVTVQEWIPVTERLPGTEKVLITNGDIVMRGYRRPDGVWKYGTELNAEWENISTRPVTHWMPLPQPPKGE